MAGLSGVFDAELWRWTHTGGRSAGPAGTASTWLTPAVRVDVDGWDGSLLSVVVDASSADGRVAASDEAVLQPLLDGAEPATFSRLARVEDALRWEGARGIRASGFVAEALELRGELGLPALDDHSDDHSDEDAHLEDGVAFESHHDLGHIEGGTRVAVDPLFVPAGIVRIDRAARIERDRESDRLTISLGVAGGVYAAEVQRLSCVVLDLDADVSIAVARFEAGVDADTGVAAIASAFVSGQRDDTDLGIVVTDRPAERPSVGLVEGRAATALARAASRAHRLGDADATRELTERSAARWRAAGTAFGPFGPPLSEPPFRGEAG